MKKNETRKPIVLNPAQVAAVVGGAGDGTDGTTGVKG